MLQRSRRCLNGSETVEHLLSECEYHGVPFLDKVLESFNNTYPSGSILTVCHRNRKKVNIIRLDGE